MGWSKAALSAKIWIIAGKGFLKTASCNIWKYHSCTILLSLTTSAICAFCHSTFKNPSWTSNDDFWSRHRIPHGTNDSRHRQSERGYVAAEIFAVIRCLLPPDPLFGWFGLFAVEDLHHVLCSRRSDLQLLWHRVKGARNPEKISQMNFLI